MKVRWTLLLWPPFILVLLLLVGTQGVFLRASFFEDLGLGLVGDRLVFDNYIEAFTSPVYQHSLLLTLKLSAAVVAAALLVSFPVAYIIARANARWAMWMLALIVLASFVSVVIKVLGLIIIFGTNGPINGFLRELNLADEPVQIIGNEFGVAVGLLHYVIGFMVLTLFSVIQTIPRSLEDAARIHGAGWWRTFMRVTVPLSLPGIVSGGLIVFNLCMGAFVSAALLGGGKVLTLPVLIQRSIVLDLRYGMSASLAAVLLVSVLIINVLSVLLLRRLRAARLFVG